MNLKTAGSSMHGLNGVSFFSFGSLASVLLALGLGYADMTPFFEHLMNNYFLQKIDNMYNM
ncbi:hypothetical protein GLOIN_2v1880741 [Rhizophagus irregularis DAOM 181602=DAOM 197198]|uniref:Uncharacterized protein n=1 Tax=Rhizophagus irregularis (strain DAOM 181602 / DAOM 197198 / MUCL 43194) TaxID=747089 RepID=A0A2P4PIM4_RHIID|nr:hypothetical protein GLOIN_2v1880741 [Rhizophagus irregularis DAOM 181602=DAOM 197198]POG65236.1 hypothetical protein GLOIN_2v1880741 [Rhizophagus irregularis DAOM 181602=DAOM 197198]|eukprot:XP_025172102.1 hypothetical protein GLOIN_2v1880741 [Rhizophagus irregularis DAOM 181602=DAOM 197198]